MASYDWRWRKFFDLATDENVASVVVTVPHIRAVGGFSSITRFRHTFSSRTVVVWSFDAVIP